MARKYGGLTGPKVSPGTQAAPGQWLAPTEAYRESTAASWPIVVPATAAYAPVGSYVYAPSSGVVDTALATNNYILASGNALSRTTYSSLYNTIGTTFGNGDGISTFNIPNLYQRHVYLKGAIASGIVMTASGQIGAQHIHLFTGYAANTSPPRNISVSDPRSQDGTIINIASSVEGTAAQNELRKKECIPLLSVEGAAVPIGGIVPLLWPLYVGAYFPVENYLICSGQAVSRTTYSALFSKLGTLYGSGNGATTFNIPDYRGIFLSGSRQPSSVTQPSGGLNYLPDAFAFHSHTFLGGSWVTNLVSPGGEAGAYASNATTPASTASVGPASESRTDNISVIWVLVAS